MGMQWNVFTITMTEAKEHVTCGGRVFISAIKDKKRKRFLTGPEGEKIELIMVGDQREYDEDIITQDGIIVAVPKYVKGVSEIEIKPGDHVYGHHFMTHDDNTANGIEYNGDQVYILEYDQIYVLMKDGEIDKVLGQWVLGEPVEIDTKPSESGLYSKPFGGHEKNYAVVTHVSKWAFEETGLQPGDKVYIHERARYKIEIEGKLYYRMRFKDIYAKVEEELCQETA